MPLIASEGTALKGFKPFSKKLLDFVFRRKGIRVLLINILRPIVRFDIYLKAIPLRIRPLSPELQTVIDDLTALMVVRTGPFAGMKYAGFESAGSSLYPKLLGTYEREIHPAIYEIIDLDYTSIVDIGCAEGYYAIGFGLKCKSPLIYAFDTDEHARRLCAKNAELNNVFLSIQGACSPSVLDGLDLGSKPLVFMDCEGYEKPFFEQITQKLLEADFFVELHDFIDLNVRAVIINLLAETHDIEMFSSIDDIDKAYEYRDSLISSLNVEDRLFLCRENRPSIMKWIFAKRKDYC